MIAIGKRAQQLVLTAVAGAVESILIQNGFLKSGNWEWQRRLEWRIDEVDLVVEEGLNSRLLPTFRVLLPRTKVSEFGEQYQHIAQINVARLLRPDQGPHFEVRLPATTLGQDKLVDSVSSDINRALPWFQQFATPELCRKNLERFLRIGCPAYLDAEHFLDSIISR